MARGAAKLGNGGGGEYKGKKQIEEADIGNFPGSIHVSPDDEGYPLPERTLQMGSGPRYGEGELIGGSYIGKRKISTDGTPIHMPGNLHAHQTLLDVTSKEYQVGKIRKQGTTPV